MRCPSCQFENREGRRFCAECGAALSTTCPSCGFSNQPGEKFCGGCGALLSDAGAAREAESPAPVAEAVAPAEAERRQVTILFADLSGFTELSRSRDPEELHRLLNRFFEAVDGTVEAYGGTIDKHMGDAVMALFGAPVAHSNDPERAVRAALDIDAAITALSDEVGESLAIHIGIASGQVMATGLGSESHREYTVMGDSVNLASRLVAMAAPGETLISDAVYRAIPHLVDADKVSEVKVKGLERPVTAWRLRSLSTGDRERAKRPFVGRRAELRQFQGVLGTYRESGTGQAIYVRGEAGIGKTRLVEEFAAVAGREGFACHSGLVLDFGVGKGQDAIRGLVRSLLEVAPGSNKTARREAAERALAEGLFEANQLIFIHDLLDVPQDAEMRAIYDAMDNDNRNRGKQESMTTLLTRISRRRPLMITVEDVQWANALTLARLAAMAQAVATCPVLLVMTSRAEGDPLDQAWRYAAGPTALMTIDLAPLREEEALALASEFVDASDRFAATCVRRAEGNPLFLEQLLRAALAAEDEAVPGSVQSIVLARVDLLSAADKQALQTAAVLGQRFSLEVLRHLIDDPSYEGDGLIAQHLVRPTGGELLFAHALIWESVYGSLLTDRRRALHRRAAGWFSDRDPALRAEHLDRADDPAAARAYAEAARAQAELFHMEPALKLVERGLAVAGDGAGRFELLVLEGEYLRESGRPADSIAAYKEALEATESDIDKCLAWIGLAAGMRVTDAYEDALSALDQAEGVARAHGLDKELAQIHYYRGNLYFPLGNIDGCLAEHRLALDYAGRAGSPEAEAQALSGLGDAYYSRGRMITALDYFRRCIELCRAQGYGRIEIANQYMIAWNRLYLNEVKGALEDALAAIEAAAQVGHQRAQMVAELTMARVLVEKADVGAAEPHVERGLALAESLGANRFIPFLMIFLGRIRLAQGGHRRDTVELMEEALKISRQTGIGFLGPWVLSTLALVSDDPGTRQKALRRGEEILRGGCVGHNYFAFYRDAMEVALAEGAWDKVEHYADSLADYMRAEPLPWCEFYIARGRALAAAARGDGEAAARDDLARLKAEAEELGLLVAVPALDRALAAA